MMASSSRLEKTNDTSMMAVTVSHHDDKHKPSTEEPSLAERVAIDFHSLAEAMFGSNPLSPQGIEMEWRGDQDTTAAAIDKGVVEERDGVGNEGFIKPQQNTIIRTSSRHLAMVLGQVVAVVVKATSSATTTTTKATTTYDCTPLEALVQDMRKERHAVNDCYYDDEIRLTYSELHLIVMRVVASAKESVQKGTKVPTGICISNFGSQRCCLDLFWGNPTTQQNRPQDVAVRASLQGPMPSRKWAL